MKENIFIAVFVAICVACAVLVIIDIIKLEKERRTK